MDDDITPNLPDDSLLRDDSSSMDSDSDSLVDVSSDNPSVEPLAVEVEAQALTSDFINKVRFPATVSALCDLSGRSSSNCSTYGSYKLSYVGNSSIYWFSKYGYRSFYLGYVSPNVVPSSDSNSFRGIYANVLFDNNFNVVELSAVPENLTFSYQLLPADLALSSDYSVYYGVTKPEEVTSADVLMIPATILAVCFFSFVYKIIKRVLF